MLLLLCIASFFNIGILGVLKSRTLFYGCYGKDIQTRKCLHAIFLTHTQNSMVKLYRDIYELYIVFFWIMNCAKMKKSL